MITAGYILLGYLVWYLFRFPGSFVLNLIGFKYSDTEDTREHTPGRFIHNWWWIPVLGEIGLVILILLVCILLPIAFIMVINESTGKTTEKWSNSVDAWFKKRKEAKKERARQRAASPKIQKISL